MTRKAMSIRPVRLPLNSSTPELIELGLALPHVERTARSIARRRGKTKDTLFLDEATTEGIFIVTELILTSLAGIKEKYPDDEKRFGFYRMSVGYGLKAYFSVRNIKTVGYLRKKGIETNHVSFDDNYVAKTDNSAMMNLMVDEAARTAMEKQVLMFFLMGNPFENIADKTGLEVARVKKVMRRIKRRLKENA